MLLKKNALAIGAFFCSLKVKSCRRSGTGAKAQKDNAVVIGDRLASFGVVMAQ